MDWGDIGVPIGDSWGSYGVGVAFGPYRGVSGIYGLGGGLSGSYRGLLGRPMGWGSFAGSMAWLGVLWIGGALGFVQGTVGGSYDVGGHWGFYGGLGGGSMEWGRLWGSYRGQLGGPMGWGRFGGPIGDCLGVL